MKKLLILTLILLLTGCSTFPTVQPEASVVVKYKYVVTEIPAELMSVPDPMYQLNLETATDKDAATWLVDSERRAKIIEERLKSIKLYQDNRIKSLNYPPEDIIRN